LKPTFNKFNKSDKYNKEYKTNKRKKVQDASVSNRASNPINNYDKQKGNQDTIKTNPSDNQIISGYFLNEKSYKELVIARLNNFLYGVLALLVVSCFVFYYFVSCSEVELNKISRQTLELNYENEELQNKVDSLQSYYNIDKAVSQANILERAKQVVEVDAINVRNKNVSSKQGKSKDSIVVSF